MCTRCALATRAGDTESSPSPWKCLLTLTLHQHSEGALVRRAAASGCPQRQRSHPSHTVASRPVLAAALASSAPPVDAHQLLTPRPPLPLGCPSVPFCSRSSVPRSVLALAPRRSAPPLEQPRCQPGAAPPRSSSPSPPALTSGGGVGHRTAPSQQPLTILRANTMNRTRVTVGGGGGSGSLQSISYSVFLPISDGTQTVYGTDDLNSSTAPGYISIQHLHCIIYRVSY